MLRRCNNWPWSLGCRDSIEKAAALQAAFRIYPYKDRATAKQGVYKGPPGKYFFGPPRGMAFWEWLHEILNREVVEERDRFFMAMLKRVAAFR